MCNAKIASLIYELLVVDYLSDSFLSKLCNLCYYLTCFNLLV